jgi:hypothetical protein
MSTLTSQPKTISCELCTTDHPEGKPCPNCECWAAIATKARKARKEWFGNRRPKQVRQPHND